MRKTSEQGERLPTTDDWAIPALSPSGTPPAQDQWRLNYADYSLKAEEHIEATQAEYQTARERLNAATGDAKTSLQIAEDLKRLERERLRKLRQTRDILKADHRRTLSAHTLGVRRTKEAANAEYDTADASLLPSSLAKNAKFLGISTAQNRAPRLWAKFKQAEKDLDHLTANRDRALVDIEVHIDRVSASIEQINNLIAELKDLRKREPSR